MRTPKRESERKSDQASSIEDLDLPIVDLEPLEIPDLEPLPIVDTGFQPIGDLEPLPIVDLELPDISEPAISKKKNKE